MINQKILIFLVVILLASCKSGDSSNLSDKFMEVGESKLEKAKSESTANRAKTKVKATMNFEEQIKALMGLGIQLNTELDVNEIFDREFGKPDYEEFGILFTLRELGRVKFNKEKSKVYFSENTYTLVSEEFNIHQSSFENLFENISRISNQQIVFENVEFSNMDNAELEKAVSFIIDERPISWDFNYNEGYFDVALVPKICEIFKMKGMGSLIWSQDGLSHTILVGDVKFLNKMSEYLNTEGC